MYMLTADLKADLKTGLKASKKRRYEPLSGPLVGTAGGTAGRTAVGGSLSDQVGPAFVRLGEVVRQGRTSALRLRMRAIRVLAVAALVALDVSAATAQSTRHFKDSWFWGVKAGELFYQSQSRPNGLAPLGGADWLITRTVGGLYASFDHSFITRDSVFVNDSLSPLDTVDRVVNIKGMRRLTLAGMLFPLQTYRMHPYIGFGATLSHITRAVPVGTYRNGLQKQLVEATIQEFRTNASPIVILGTQLRLLGVSAFVQGTASPTSNNFFLWTGTGWRATVEGGVRYNIGSSIDRLR
jgi:hypothetical protein